jgi:hypothetical protein
LAELGRKPTLEELLGTLTSVLRNRSAEFVESEGGGVVTEIRAKSSKKATKPRLEAGDIFCVPLGNGECAFGRLTPQLSVAEFFEVTGPPTMRASKLLRVPTFRLPGLLMLDPLKDGRWKIVERASYENAEAFEIQPFRIGSQIECGDARVKGFIDPSSKLRPASEAELRSVPEHSLWNAELVEKELRERLAKRAKT